MVEIFAMYENISDLFLVNYAVSKDRAAFAINSYQRVNAHNIEWI